MSDAHDSLPLLRVLAAVAWSDGELAPEEAAFVRGLMAGMELDGKEREEIEGLLARPVPRADFDRYAGEFESRVSGEEPRRRLLAEVLGLIDSDRVRRPEELECLRHLRDWLSDAADEPDEGPGAVLEHLTNALKLTRIGEVPAAATGFATRIFRSLQAAVKGPGAADRVTADRRDYVMLFGALLERVARADAVHHPEETARIRGLLERRFGWSEAEVDTAVRLLEGRIAEDLDRQRLCAEFNRITTPEQRLELIRALFAVAQADGVLAAREEEEIRLIANYLWVETQDFVEVRLRALREGTSA